MKATRAVTLGLLVLALVLLVVAVERRSTYTEPEGPTTGFSVVVLAVDGLDWFVLSHLVRAGRLPTFERFMRSGFPGEVEVERPIVPDVEWTILAQGRALDEADASHVSASDYPRLYGVRPGIAEAVTVSGGTALVVGWPATWPAADFGATIVAPFEQTSTEHEASLTPSIFTGAPASVRPESLSGVVDHLIERNESEYVGEFERRIYGGPTPDGSWREHLAAARWAFLADAINADVAARLIAEQEPDLAMVYLGGLDAVSHRFLGAAGPMLGDQAVSSDARFEDVLGAYYEYVDSVVARLRALYGADTLFIVCSASGINPTRRGDEIFGSHSEGRPGVFLMDGPRVKGRASTMPMSTMDVAPTILAALGVEIPTNTDGRIVPEALPQDHLEYYPARYTDRKSVARETPSEEMKNTLERLAAERVELISSDLSR